MVTGYRRSGLATGTWAANAVGDAWKNNFCWWGEQNVCWSIVDDGERERDEVARRHPPIRATAMFSIFPALIPKKYDESWRDNTADKIWNQNPPRKMQMGSEMNEKLTVRNNSGSTVRDGLLDFVHSLFRVLPCDRLLDLSFYRPGRSFVNQAIDWQSTSAMNWPESSYPPCSWTVCTKPIKPIHASEFLIWPFFFLKPDVFIINQSDPVRCFFHLIAPEQKISMIRSLREQSICDSVIPVRWEFSSKDNVTEFNDLG